MEQMTSLLLLFAGLWIGGAVVWFVMNQKSQQAAERAKAGGESERATLTERLVARDAQIEQLREQVDSHGFEAARLRGELKTELEKRTIAEEKAAQGVAALRSAEERDRLVTGLQAENSDLKARLAELTTKLEEGQKAADEKLAIIQEASEKFADAFKALSADALKSNNQAFLDLAATALERYREGSLGDLDGKHKAIEELVKPLQESLSKVDEKIQDLETARAGAYSGLIEQVKSLQETQENLKREAAGLVNALRTPAARGRWGEVQLKRVVELAGMVEHCDFVEQPSAEGEHGRFQPDMVIKLPNHRQIVVDSKVSLSAYLDAAEARDEETRSARLRQHAQQIRMHLTKLSAKSYWEQFQPSPEFVIAFLPGESFFSAALDHDPGLIEFGVNQRVLLATPTTLIALLKAVAYGWRQDRVAESAQAISDLGKSLYARLRLLGEHFQEIQKHLERTNAAYNRAAATLESRVFASARRFKDLGAGVGGDLEVPPVVDNLPRSIHALELALPQGELADPVRVDD